MNKKKIMFSLFIAMAVLQIVAVAGIIARYELILAAGKSFKFKTAPVDPYDAFRGRYLALDIKDSKVKCKNASDFKYNEKIYAIIEVGKDGFAKFAKLQHERPEKGVDYLQVKVGWVSRYEGREEVNLKIPFDRFYLEENEAFKAEHAYRAESRKENTYIEVKVLNGYGVIEELFIDSKPVREYINR